MRRIVLPACATAVAVVCVGTATFASAAAAAALPSSHGQLLHLAPFHATANATQSSNWVGYDQGSLEQGGKLFNSVGGEWTVPKATPHASGQAASSSDWLGVGGGCVDSGCTVTDQTLIQTGTEQDVSATGAATYSAWWEEIPAPSVTITTVNVSPGDRMYASVAETIPDSNVWTITLKDLTNGQSFSTTVPYASTHTTAEWIEENPLILGTTGSGFSTLPNLASPAFDLATTDGAPVKLTASEQMQLIDANGNVIGAPSAPDPEGDGFNACAWATTCATPAPATAKASAGRPRKPSAKHTTARPKRKRHGPAKPRHKQRSAKKRPAKHSERTRRS
ncbi:MAG TPA: G1 family glutamic endopeptidase [Solirubrobacteraceae bacterium]|nr:G1 family glutamic endopeptidase [Solirubrobacteraceae bacterium]